MQIFSDSTDANLGMAAAGILFRRVYKRYTGLESRYTKGNDKASPEKYRLNQYFMVIPTAVLNFYSRNEGFPFSGHWWLKLGNNFIMIPKLMD
ncbi:hypothetical protein GCM10007423_22530 [Dyadobacter endophyticus]|uniref:Uncharacterized protein n=1 Tax=Dyadobacter endophyticus TaxID=1749036 RepID=A0ABQ1YQ97_9BACT|nr:hypothetical protein GCM10007423_22530 [Dyadobacter endophyticus]